MNDYWGNRYGLGAFDNYDPPELTQNIKMELTSAPTLSIVSLDEAKTHLFASSGTTVNDDKITSIINAATGIIEQEAGGIALCEQTWKQYQQGGISTIDLQREPILSNPTVSYYSDFDTVTATNITVTTHFRAVRNELFHKDGYWDQGREGDGYVIEYTVGMFTASTYTTSDDLRLNTFKEAILRTCSWLFDQREEGVSSIKEGNWSVNYQNGMLPEGIRRLIMPYHSGKGILG